MAEDRDIGIGLAELLKSLRQELDIAEKHVANLPGGPKLYLEASEVELAFTVSRSAETGGGLKFSVLGIGADLNAKGLKGSQSVHRIKISLKAAGSPVGIAR
jgi:hypothetical protein